MAGVNRQLNLILDLKDKASKELTNFQKKLKTSQQDLKTFAKIGTASFLALAGATGIAVKAFQAQERAEKRLETLVRNTTDATDEQIEALKQQASALQRVGVVGDEVTIVGQSQLATFALTTDKIKELTPALLDMIVATKGVNATQEDAINVANAVGRALEGGAGALTRYGISLTDAQRELFETADKMERVTLLAEILNDNFGGLNEATRQTSEGGVRALKNSFGDLLELIGEGLAPLIDDMVVVLNDATVQVTGYIEEHGSLIDAMSIGFLVFRNNFRQLFRGMGLILQLHLLDVKNMFFEVWGSIKDFFNDIINSIIGSFESAINFIIGGLNSVIRLVNSFISQLSRIPFIGNKVSDALQIKEFSDIRLNRVGGENNNFSVAPGLLGGGQSVQPNQTIINVSGNTLLDEDSAEKIGDEIMSRLKLSTQI